MKSVACVALALVILAPVAIAQELDVHVVDERRVVELTGWLEQNPLDENDTVVRARLLDWWVGTPNRELHWCAGLLADATNEVTAALVVTQGLFGSGAYLLEHEGDPAMHEFAASLAGVKSGLRAYRRIVSRNAALSDPFYDGLLAREDAGTLDGYVREELDGCRAARWERQLDSGNERNRGG